MSDQLQHGADRPPDGGGRDRMRAVARSPGSVFLYWELDGPVSAEAARAAGPEGQWVLRIVDLSDGSSRTVPAAPERRSQYVEVRPGGAYGFELAVRSKGGWRTVCRTQRVDMPPAQPGPLARRRGPLQRGGRGAPQRARAARGIPGLDYQATLPHMGSSPGGSASR